MPINLSGYYYPVLANIKDPSLRLSAKQIVDHASDDLTAISGVNALLGYNVFSNAIAASNPYSNAANAIASSDDGTLSSSLPENYSSYKEAIDTLDVRTQLVNTRIGDLSSLNTVRKDNLTDAINQALNAINNTTASGNIGTTDITGIVTLAGDAVDDTLTAVVVAIDNKVGTTALTGVTPLGASAPTTVSSGLSTLATAVGTSAFNSVGLRGAVSAVPSTIKVAIDNIDAALGNGQLLENSAGSGTVSGVIGTISTGLLGMGGTTIAESIGNTAITTTAQTLSGAINEINTKVGATALTGVTPLGASAPTTLSSGLATLATAIGSSAFNSVGLRGAVSAAPSTIKVAIDNIDAALGNGQLLENSAGSGTVSGVIGTISTGLLGMGGTTIAGAIGNTAITTTAQTLSGAVNEINNIVGTTDITGIVTLAGGAVADTVSAAIVAVDNKVGTTALTGVTPLGASAPTTLSSGLSTLATAIGSSAFNSVGLRGAVSAAPSTIKVAIDNIDAALGNGQLLENSAGSGTVSGVIGTISTGLLGMGGTTIAGAIGNTAITTTAATLSGAINEINNIVGTTDITGIVTLAGGAVADTVSAAIVAVDNKVGTTALTGVTPLGASAPTTLSSGLSTLATAIGSSAFNSVGLRGAVSAAPSTIKVAIDNIDAALGNGQLLENSAGSGTVSGVIGTISTGLLGMGGTTIAGAIGNTAITTTAASLSGAINEINANSWVTSTKIADGAITATKIANGAITAAKIASAAITSSKQGFATWNVDGTHSWVGTTDTLMSPISGCSNSGTIGDSTTYYSAFASSPSAGDHVDIADLFAILVQCGQHCTTGTGLFNCFTTFFNFL